jgi:hypothetical protein
MLHSRLTSPLADAGAGRGLVCEYVSQLVFVGCAEQFSGLWLVQWVLSDHWLQRVVRETEGKRGRGVGPGGQGCGQLGGTAGGVGRAAGPGRPGFTF